jgi:hypothetical protein
LFLTVLAIAGFVRGTVIQRRIHDRMREVWTAALASPGATEMFAMSPADDTWVHRLRAHGAYQMIFRALKWWLVPSAFGLGILWAGTTLAIWALLSLAAVVLGPRMPEMLPSHLMAVGAVATLALVAVAEWRSIWRRLVDTFRRHGGAPASLSISDSRHFGVRESWSPAAAGSASTPAIARPMGEE